MRRFFITGTNTDCGKTYVTTQLLRFFSRSAAIKPIASGCVNLNGQLINPDVQLIHEQCHLPVDIINPWRFKLPVSPHIAARQEGVLLSAKEIADYCMQLQLNDIDSLFIEGAGGLIVPINEKETWVDFLQLTELPVILVVGMTLGCINHALLTAAALSANYIQCVGWIANCIDSEMLALSDNIQTLTDSLKIPLLATVPYEGTIHDINLRQMHL